MHLSQDYISLIQMSAIFVLLATTVNSEEEEECMYSKELDDVDPLEVRVPCMNTNGRAPFRKLECVDGTVIHLCCRLPFRGDKQDSRQRAFRIVTRYTHQLSPECTKRGFCEQACKDGVVGRVSSSFPEVVSNDTSATKSYVHAFKAGEALSCYNLGKEGMTFRTCELECQVKYPQCDQDLSRRGYLRGFFMYTRLFHNYGVWVFNTYWWIKDFSESKGKFDGGYGNVGLNGFQLPGRPHARKFRNAIGVML